MTAVLEQSLASSCIPAAEASVERHLRVSVSISLAVILAVVLAAILWLCDGHLIYSLDDPYISLSLGWHLWHGHYGINVGEAASPASSILYPLVLAAFGWTDRQDWVPLAINTAAAIGTGVTFASAFCRYGIVTRSSQLGAGTALVIVLCVAVNTVGLVFVGLEHSLHAMASVLIVFGLARTFGENRVPPSLLLAIVLAPLLRFEGLALALLAIAGLVATAHFRAGAVALGGVAATLAAYVAATHVLGLPLLPSSVLSKSVVATRFVDGGFSPLGFAMFALHEAIRRLTVEAIPVILLTALVVAHPLRRAMSPSKVDGRSWSLFREAVFASVVAGALLAHILFGAWGWSARYEAYAVAFGAAGTLVLWRHSIAAFVARGRVVFASVVLLGIGSFYVDATLYTPVAATEIYAQQYQMHRFVTGFYRQPVGVNDLGWVSYRNPDYVLDLYGLGSEAVRLARAAGEPGSVWMDRLVRAKHVGLVMLYDQWFVDMVPQSWKRLGTLRSPHPAIAASDSKVAFYATSTDAVAPALAAMRAFRPHLVRGATLTISGAPAATAAGEVPARP